MVMSSEERIIRALKRKEVDRVPTFEWLIDKKVIESISPGSSYEKFVYEMGIDAICVDADYKTEEIEDGLYKDEWGIIKKDTGEAHTIPISGPIKTMKDLDKYIPPDPYKEDRFQTLETKLEEHKGEKAVILHLNDVFSIPSRLMKFDDFMISMIDKPQLVEGLIDLSVEVNRRRAGGAGKRGVKIVYTGDDYAYNSGPMMQPELFKDIFYPRLYKVMQGYKDLGLYVIKHTDGNIMPIIDMIIDSGIDCLDPIDPIAGMNLAEIKNKYGDKIAIKGNVDCANTLTDKDVEKTVKETKECLKTAAPGGGYILSSSNSIHSGVNPESYVAMLETLKEYGKYPIKL